ncbi:MAG: FkbM family methyltransferase, partial [Candidatus Aenigmatarchaeota archaeon]
FSSLSSIYDYDISKIYDITKGKKVKIIIKARKLDDILKKLKIKNVDMMKLDVEGSEPEVF